jgi:hypothetical protein
MKGVDTQRAWSMALGEEKTEDRSAEDTDPHRLARTTDEDRGERIFGDMVIWGWESREYGYSGNCHNPLNIRIP